MEPIDILVLAIFVLFLVVSILVIPVACMLAAGRRNRNRAGWFFLGFLGIIPLIVITFLPSIERDYPYYEGRL